MLAEIDDAGSPGIRDVFGERHGLGAGRGPVAPTLSLRPQIEEPHIAPLDRCPDGLDP